MNQALADRIGQAIIDEVVDRTLSGKGVDGESFDRYSKEYKESDEFVAFAKSSKPNMQLTGSMLGQMDVIETTSDSIKIGWSDDEQNAKAYNHNVGDTVPERPFFGVTSGEIDKIKSKFRKEINDAKDLQTASTARTVGDLLTTVSGASSLPGDPFLGDDLTSIFASAALRLLDRG